MKENIKCLETGEVITKDGSYLGRNNSDTKEDCYFINLSAIAGNPVESKDKKN